MDQPWNPEDLPVLGYDEREDSNLGGTLDPLQVFWKIRIPDPHFQSTEFKFLGKRTRHW
jgi:hypothetical protein